MIKNFFLAWGGGNGGESNREKTNTHASAYTRKNVKKNYTTIPGRTADCTVVNVLCNIFPVAPAALSRAVSFTN